MDSSTPHPVDHLDLGALRSPGTPAASGARHDPFKRFSSACALLVIALAGLALAGWLSRVLLLASFRREYIPMAPNTAFAFMALGAGVWAIAR